MVKSRELCVEVLLIRQMNLTNKLLVRKEDMNGNSSCEIQIQEQELGVTTCENTRGQHTQS